MSKKVQVNEHHTTTRERVSAPGHLSMREMRRKRARRAARAITKERMDERLAENPRLTKFHF